MNALTSSGETPLILASRNGHLECASLLTFANAEINIVESKEGNTALMTAVQGGFPEVIDLLLSAGADVNIMDKHGRNALVKAQAKLNHQISVAESKVESTAALEGKLPGLAKVLLSEGADVN